MNGKKQTNKARIAELERKLAESNAQLSYVYHFANIGIQKANCATLKGGGIIVRLHHLGGKEVCPAFMIKDGFSQDTIDGLARDIWRSYESAIELAPARVKSDS